MIDFKELRKELQAEQTALIATPKEDRAPGTFDRICWLGNAVTHCDFCVDRQLGGKQWKTYERRTGRSTLEAYV